MQASSVVIVVRASAGSGRLRGARGEFVIKAWHGGGHQPHHDPAAQRAARAPFYSNRRGGIDGGSEGRNDQLRDTIRT
jgi:hypothetical protein